MFGVTKTHDLQPTLCQVTYLTYVKEALILKSPSKLTFKLCQLRINISNEISLRNRYFTTVDYFP